MVWKSVRLTRFASSVSTYNMPVAGSTIGVSGPLRSFEWPCGESGDARS